MKLIDSHAHMDSNEFDSDRAEVFQRIKDNMDFIVNIGYDIESSKKGVKYSKEYDFIYAAVGIHPDDIEGYNDELEQELEELAKDEKVLAIGEIGLDYHWMTRPKEEQQEIFRRQMKVAERGYCKNIERVSFSKRNISLLSWLSRNCSSGNG